MSPVITDSIRQQAANHLSRHDPFLAPVIAVHGRCTMVPHRNYYQELMDSIISQQLSVKAAATIAGRFRGLFHDQWPSPQQLLDTPEDILRSVGLSKQKANYIRDLAGHVADGRLTFDDLDALPNADVITKLTDIKGIGEWTAHMFLMFCMGRTDVLAHGDLGIRNGVRNLYNMDQAPSPAELQQLAEQYQWHPYESIACWYIWRSLDNVPK